MTAMRLLLLSLAMCLPGLAMGQESFRDWTVVRGTSGCAATVSVGLVEPSSGLLTLALFERADQGDVPAVMTARVPVGAALNTPFSYVHPGASEAVALSWQYCDDQTCMASGGVSAQELERLKAGRQVLVAFRPLPGSKSLVVPVSLLGSTRAWEAVQACE